MRKAQGCPKKVRTEQVIEINLQQKLLASTLVFAPKDQETLVFKTMK